MSSSAQQKSNQLPTSYNQLPIQENTTPEIIFIDDHQGVCVEFVVKHSSRAFRAIIPFHMFDEGQVRDFWERLEDCCNECHDPMQAEGWESLESDIIAALWMPTAL